MLSTQVLKLERMIKEASDLQFRIHSLEEYIATSEHYASQPSFVQIVTTTQQIHMTGYLSNLKTRIKYLKLEIQQELDNAN